MRVLAQGHDHHIGPVVQLTHRLQADGRPDMHVVRAKMRRHATPRRDVHVVASTVTERFGERDPVAVTVVADCTDAHRRMQCPRHRHL